MALDYRRCAQEIFSHLGGRENIISAAHCATRLRLVIADNSKVDKKELEDVEGVKGMFESNGQLQLIIGTGTVNKVYDEFLDITGMTAATKADVKAAAAARQPLPKRLIKVLGDVFVPILPAIVASGLMMGLVEAIGKASPAFVNSDWYSFLDMVSGAAFAYLPVIIAVWIMCMVEKWLHKHVPEMLDLFVTPLCTVLFTTFITFTIIGPIFSTAETYILHGAQLLIIVGHGVGAAAMGAIYPVTVVMGLHHMYNVIEAGMLAEKNGINIWMPIATAANFAQFGACLAVAVKTKSHKRREIAFPSSLSASLGITEPAIFGVNLRLMKPFVCGMIGGAVGAWFGSISHLGAKAYGVTGIPGLLTINHIPLYLVELAIAGGIAFALTMVVWKEDPAEQDHPKGEEDVLDALVEEKEEPNREMPVLIRCEAGEVHAPAYGQIIPREEIKDETFASGVLGDGVGIEPEVGLVVAPFDGEIANVAETGHAIGLEGPGDMELLIHIGVDTVKMKGKGFHPLVKEGDHVTAGQKLLEFDRDEIAKAGFPDTVVVLLTNSDDYEDVKCYGDLQKEEE